MNIFFVVLFAIATAAAAYSVVPASPTVLSDVANESSASFTHLRGVGQAIAAQTK